MDRLADANAAVERADMDIEKTLLEREDNRHKTENTSLFSAAENGDIVTVRAQITEGANVNVQNECGETPLLKASSWKRMDIVKFLIEAGANVDVQDKKGDTSLHLASSYNSVGLVRALITAGANVNLQNYCGKTPLHTASSLWSSIDVVELLIEAGANVDVQDENGDTSLHLASSEKFVNIVRALITAGANVNVQNYCGTTPLHEASWGSSTDVVELLIEAGAHVDVQDNKGVTSLYIASYHHSSVNIVRALITAGADVNVQIQSGETPLHIASWWSTIDVVELLIEAGADINAVDSYGQTVLGGVCLYDIADLLVSHIIRLEAARLYVSEKNLQERDVFINNYKWCNKCLQHSRVCKEEGNKLKRENITLYKLLTESDIDKLCSIWGKCENVSSNFNNRENLKDQYPEYACILINKSNEVRKEIFLHNHRPLVDVLSIHYECGVNKMTFAGMKNFLNFHSVDFKEKLGNGGLTLCSFVDFQDIKERHIPKLKVLAFETFLSKCCTKNFNYPVTEHHQGLFCCSTFQQLNL